ncbi:hypothetical protein C0J52_24165 [Blattella germanica]|nr:hypothetical protein C0J52_24165 [Blattella germanica]
MKINSMNFKFEPTIVLQHCTGTRRPDLGRLPYLTQEVGLYFVKCDVLANAVHDPLGLRKCITTLRSTKQSSRSELEQDLRYCHHMPISCKFHSVDRCHARNDRFTSEWLRQEEEKLLPDCHTLPDVVGCTTRYPVLEILRGHQCHTVESVLIPSHPVLVNSLMCHFEGEYMKFCSKKLWLDMSTIGHTAHIPPKLWFVLEKKGTVELRHRIAAAVQQVTPDMLQRVWQEIDFRWDVCRMTNGAHIEP